MRRGKEVRHVGAQGKIDAQLILVPWLLIILCNAFSNFTGSDPHNRIIIGVVIAWSPEDVHPKGSFFQRFRLSGQRLFDNKS